MAGKNSYREQNEAFMVAKAAEEGVRTLPGGILYDVITEGAGRGGVTPRTVAVCHYRGELINGKVFDDSWNRGCPEAFRVADLIEGFQVALCAMCIGDRWRLYIPWTMAYGKRGGGGIPGYSTLIFEIELVNIA